MRRACGTSGTEEESIVRKVRRKESLGRPRRRWVDNVKVDLREIEWGGMDWIDLAQERDQWRVLFNTIINLRIHRIVGNF
jgi:hypothetical protein